MAGRALDFGISSRTVRSSLQTHSRVRYLPDRDYLGHSKQSKTTEKAVRRAHIRAPEQLGAWVRAQRRAHGLTQIEVAEIARVGPRFVGDLERGKSTVHIGKVFKVLEILGLTVTLEDIDPIASIREGSS